MYPGLRAVRSARHPAGRGREAPSASRRCQPEARAAPGPPPAGGEGAAAREHLGPRRCRHKIATLDQAGMIWEPIRIHRSHTTPQP